MAETMQEYLVKIGWNVDENSFKKTRDTIDDIKDSLIGSASKIASSFTKAAGIIVGDVIYSVNEQMFSIIETTAQLDYQTERLARQYWSTEKNVRSFATALDVLGESESSMMYMTDEQYKRFIQLNQLGRTLEAPKELDEYLVKVRDINFEFSRLKMIAQYGTRWVTYWLSQLTGKDTDAVLKKLRSINDYIIKNLPKITAQISKFFYFFYRMGKTIMWALKGIGNAVVSVLDIFDSSVGRVIALVGVLSAALVLSPVFAFVAALTALLLVIEDYMSWREGKQTLFDWTEFDKSFTDLKQTLSDVSDTLTPIKEKITEIFDSIDLKQKLMDGLKAWLDSISGFLDLIDIALDGISSTIKTLQGDLSGLEMGDVFEKFNEAVDKVSGSPALTIGRYVQNPGQALTDWLFGNAKEKITSGEEDTDSSSTSANTIDKSDTESIVKCYSGIAGLYDSLTTSPGHKMYETFGSAPDWMIKAFGYGSSDDETLNSKYNGLLSGGLGDLGIAGNTYNSTEKTLTQNNEINITVANGTTTNVQNAVEKALISNRNWMERVL